MPYVFTDWTHCTDPAGGSHVLNWSAPGGADFPVVYIEALRQAVLMRMQAANYSITGAPGEVSSGYGMVSLYTVLNYIDTYAWYLGSGRTPYYWGWLDPAHVADIAGDPNVFAWPAVMQTAADLLAAAGHASRITLSRSMVGSISGAYLSQLRDVLRAKRFYAGYGEITGGAGATGKLGRDWEDPPANPVWAHAEAAFLAAAWGSGGVGFIPSYRVTGIESKEYPWERGMIEIMRMACSVGFGVYYPSGCKHSTAYLYAIPYSTFYNPDYPTLSENVWSKYINDQPLAYGASELMCKLDNAGAEPPGGLPYYYWGYQIKHRYHLLDYREDFVLNHL